MVFEEVVELLVAEQVGDAGANPVGVLGVAPMELGVNGLADFLNAVSRQIAPEDGVSLVAIFGVMVVDGAVLGFE